MANKKLQLKRNETIFTSKEDAVKGLVSQLVSASAGEPIIAIYTAETKEYVLLGIKGTSGYQIFEGAGVGADDKIEIPKTIQDAIDAVQAKIDALDVTDEADENKYVSAVSQEDGKITITRQNILSDEENNVLELKNGSLYLNGDFDSGVY